MLQKKWTIWGKLLLVLMALGCLIGVTPFALVCWRSGVERVPEPSDCLVVLGARVYPDGRMSLVLKERVDAALAAWRDGLAPYLIVSGARGGDEPRAEAVVMAEYLCEQGVPEDRVIVDDLAHNTRENIANASAIMRERGWTRAIIVTSDYHVERALWLAGDAGLDASGLAAPTPHTFRAYWWGRIRETISWVLYFFHQL